MINIFFQFELSRQSLPTGQYLFVNGHLAHDDDSMIDLKVGPNTVFVLFELTRTKVFHDDVSSFVF